MRRGIKAIKNVKAEAIANPYPVYFSGFVLKNSVNNILEVKKQIAINKALYNGPVNLDTELSLVYNRPTEKDYVEKETKVH